MVRTVPSVLERVNIWILLSSELPHVVWYIATTAGNPDISILRPENGGTRFLGMFVTFYQPTCCDNQKTTVFTTNGCKNLTVFLGDCEKIKRFGDYLLPSLGYNVTTDTARSCINRPSMLLVFPTNLSKSENLCNILLHVDFLVVNYLPLAQPPT